MNNDMVDQSQVVEGDPNNVMNFDEPEAVFMDGRLFYIPGDVALNGDLESVLNSNGIIQYIDDSANTPNDNPEIYYTDGQAEVLQVNGSQNLQLALIDGSHSTVDQDRIEGEFVNIESLMESMTNMIEEEGNENEEYQYIIQLGNYNLDDSNEQFLISGIHPESCNETIDVENVTEVDISKITGKNLLTGQTVTLDGYLEKVKNSSKDLTLEKAEEISLNLRKKGNHTALSNLLNKKLTIGKTAKGQRLVGRVIHVGKKDSGESPPATSTDNFIEEDELGLSNHFSVTPQETEFVTVQAPESEDLYLMEPYNVTPHGTEFAPTVPEPVNDDLFVTENFSVSVLPQDTELADALPELVSDEASTMQAFIGTPETTAENEIHLDDSNAPEIPDVRYTNQDMLEYVSKTLVNLMNMNTVAKKLKKKNLVVKVVEKIIRDGLVRTNIHQMKGYLELQGGLNGDMCEYNWVFRLDAAVEAGGRGGHINRGFKETMKVSIFIHQVDGIVQSTKVSLSSHMEKCTVCTKKFRTIYKLKSHMDTVHKASENQFQCQTCNEQMQNNEEFVKHQQQHVDNGEVFSCDTCEKPFPSEAKLKKHINVYHITDKRTVKMNCKVCGEVFHNLSAWKEHIISHNKAKPYKCDQCPKKFLTVADLNYHARVHDSKSCYVCKVCNRMFARYSNLQRHAEVHGNRSSMNAYSCSTCGCTFNYVSSLTRHIVQNHRSA